MKKCKLCESSLKLIGEIEPDTYLVSTKSPALNPFDGAGYMVIFLLAGLLATLPLWGSQLTLSIIIICICGGFGAYLWQKPRKFYRCVKCGAEYYGDSLLRHQS